MRCCLQFSLHLFHALLQLLRQLLCSERSLQRRSSGGLSLLRLKLHSLADQMRSGSASIALITAGACCSELS